MRIFFFALFSCAFVTNAQATTYNVTSTDAVGFGTFRQAILNSNATPGGTHTINFIAPFPDNGLIELGNNLPTIVSNKLTIAGGSKKPLIDGKSLHSILRIGNATTRLELSDLTLQNGFASEMGGCVFASNSNSTSPVLSATRIAISNCEVSGVSLIRGGGIYWGSSSGSVSLTDSRLTGNIATATGALGEANGGAVYARTNFQSLRTVYESNAAMSATGGGTGGAVLLSGSSTSNTITESTFRFNGASATSPLFGYGGAMNIACEDCSTQIVRSYFRGNAANYGGGIFARKGSGGAVNVFLTLVNTTFYNNSVLDEGGAVLMGIGTSLSASNNTFYNSDATAGAHLAFTQMPEVSFFRANLLAPTSFGTACSGSFTLPTPGFVNVNLFSDSSCAGLATGSLPNAPLGSVTIDERPGEIGVVRFGGSAVIDSISLDSLCEPRDARFTIRPEDGDGNGVARCDVGAYESPFDIIFYNGFDR